MFNLEEIEKYKNSVKAQHEENLKAYGVKVREISEEIDVLTKTRDNLLYEIKDIQNRKEEIISQLSINAKQKEEVAASILAESREKQSELEDKQKEFEAYRSEKLIHIEAFFADVSKKNDSANAKEVEVKNKLNNIAIKEKELNDLIVKNIQESTEVSIAKSQVDKQNAIVDEELKKMQVARQEYLLKKKEVDFLQKELSDKIAKANDLITNHSSVIKEIEKEKELVLVEKDKFFCERDELINALKEQNNINKFRSKELDIGFDKLTRDTESLKKESKKIEEMKKEIMQFNKGE